VMTLMLSKFKAGGGGGGGGGGGRAGRDSYSEMIVSGWLLPSMFSVFISLIC